MNSNSIDRTYGIIAYCTLIGWIISVIRVSSSEGEERKFSAFHLRQMLLLMLLGAAASIAGTILYFVPFVGLLLINIISLSVFVCWLILFISAIRGEKKYLPLIGKAGENMLGDMFE